MKTLPRVKHRINFNVARHLQAKLAVETARLIGQGLYGVDLKQTGNRVLVIEVNDNPNLDAGIEDAVLGDELYRRVLLAFVQRLERKHLGQAW